MLVNIEAGRVSLTGDLVLSPHSRRLVVFVHSSGASRLDPRNRYVASALQATGLGTLLLDLLTPDERDTEALDIGLLTTRLSASIEWLGTLPHLSEYSIGLFGESTGAAAAMFTAVKLRTIIGAVVSRSGRPDLAGAALEHVEAPTLLIVGDDDAELLRHNRAALVRLHGACMLHVVEHSGPLFEEPGALDEVIRVARQWFIDHLGTRAHPWLTTAP